MRLNERKSYKHYETSYCNKVEQGEHGHTKVSPVPLVSSIDITKEVIANDGKDEHENEEEQQKVQHCTAERVNKCSH